MRNKNHPEAYRGDTRSSARPAAESTQWIRCARVPGSAGVDGKEENSCSCADLLLRYQRGSGFQRVFRRRALGTRAPWREYIRTTEVFVGKGGRSGVSVTVDYS